MVLDHRDSSGFRFYLGNKRNRHEFGYLAFGTDSSPAAIAIPPGAQQFMVDSYCPAEVTKVRASLVPAESNFICLTEFSSIRTDTSGHISTCSLPR